ncbi:protein disulfide isomerase [Anaeramoeba ignava]|uniref:Protein disulfide isomerase n=1 Tax=Anaeramoeba ignava TaxID=1746090 RepID=A0A9Q0LBG0_ANAIG|nr:protein disulfide isomerase [Anaeramoeba ignava]
MNHFILLILFTFTISFVFCEEETTENIKFLNNKNFEEILTEKKYSLVVFYEPNSIEWKRFFPELKKTAEIITMLPDIVICAVDISQNRKLKNQFDIQKNLELKIFSFGTFLRNYLFAPEAPHLVAFLTKLHFPLVSKLTSLPQIQKFRTQFPFIGIGILSRDPKEQDRNEKIHSVFEDLAPHIDFSSMLFGVSITDLESDIAKEFNITQLPVFLLFRNLDNEILSLPLEPLSVELISEFFDQNQIPFIQELDESNFLFYLEYVSPLGILFLDYQNREEYLKIEKEVAKKFYPKMYFVWVNGEKVQSFAEKFGIHAPFPKFIILENLIQNKYIRFKSHKISENYLIQSVEDYFNNKTSYSTKSEKIPDNENRLVKKVVFKNWDEMITNSDKTIFLLLNTHWDEISQEIEQDYLKFASFMKENSNVLVAEFNLALNDFSQDLEFSEIPQLILIPKDKSKNIIFQKEFSFENFIEFAKENGIKEFTQKEDRKDFKEDL